MERGTAQLGLGRHCPFRHRRHLVGSPDTLPITFGSFELAMLPVLTSQQNSDRVSPHYSNTIVGQTCIGATNRRPRFCGHFRHLGESSGAEIQRAIPLVSSPRLHQGEGQGYDCPLPCSICEYSPSLSPPVDLFYLPPPRTNMHAS